MDDGGLGIRNWGGYYDHQPAVKGLGLNLMSNMGGGEGDTKPLLPNGAFLHRDCVVPDHAAVAMQQYTSWIRPREGNRFLHVPPNYPVMQDPQSAANPPTLQMLQPPESTPIHDEPAARKEAAPPKKRSQAPRRGGGGGARAKKQRKQPGPRDEGGGASAAAAAAIGGGSGKPSSSSSGPRGRGARKSSGIMINGINLDISGLPTPVCSCTGAPQQCYRWGIGGWQSACCTTTVSMYPLPMSTKRQGARIAGRKMSQGAFTKVLEKLAGEGYNLGNPIDLSGHWAKHGTNKYVTIR
ncbi:protein BASIC PENTACYSTEINE1-like [Wolffia australiana]